MTVIIGIQFAIACGVAYLVYFNKFCYKQTIETKNAEINLLKTQIEVLKESQIDKYRERYMAFKQYIKELETEMTELRAQINDLKQQMGQENADKLLATTTNMQTSASDIKRLFQEGWSYSFPWEAEFISEKKPLPYTVEKEGKKAEK